MQWRRWGSNPRPFCLESSTLPLSHWAPNSKIDYFYFEKVHNKGTDQTLLMRRLVWPFVFASNKVTISHILIYSSDIQVNYKLHLWPVLSKLMDSIDQRKGCKVTIQEHLPYLLLISCQAMSCFCIYSSLNTWVARLNNSKHSCWLKSVLDLDLQNRYKIPPYQTVKNDSFKKWIKFLECSWNYEYFGVSCKRPKVFMIPWTFQKFNLLLIFTFYINI